MPSSTARAWPAPVVLLDYETNADIENLAKPLSHAALVARYLEGTWPAWRAGWLKSDLPPCITPGLRGAIPGGKSDFSRLAPLAL